MLEICRLAQQDQSRKTHKIWPLCYEWSKSCGDRSEQNIPIDSSQC